MWGFFNARNRKIANNIFTVITNKSIASQFKNGNQKGNDQYLHLELASRQIPTKYLIFWSHFVKDLMDYSNNFGYVLAEI